MQQHDSQQPGQQPGTTSSRDIALSHAAASYAAVHSSVAQLSAGVLEKLLSQCCCVSVSEVSSTADNNSSSSSSSSMLLLLQSSQWVALTLAAAFVEADGQETGFTDASSIVTSAEVNSMPSELPTPYPQCCNLLQVCVRLAGSAAAAAADPLSNRGGLADMLDGLARTLAHAPLTEQGGCPFVSVSCVVSYPAAAGDVSLTDNLDAVQLFGFLCSLLKVCNDSGSGSSSSGSTTTSSSSSAVAPLQPGDSTEEEHNRSTRMLAMLAKLVPVGVGGSANRDQLQAVALLAAVLAAVHGGSCS